MDFTEIGRGVMGWIDLVQDREQCLAEGNELLFSKQILGRS
jgi:hypothetical protein